MGLEIREIKHSFGDLVALDGVSFTVVPGVITGLLGPNGAGKTTLLRIMLGVLSPDSGSVRYDGRHPGVQPALLWHVPPAAAVLFAHRPAVVPDAAAVGAQDPEHDPQQRRLAGTVGSEQSGDHSGHDGEAHSVEGHQVTEGVLDLPDLEPHVPTLSMARPRACPIGSLSVCRLLGSVPLRPHRAG